MKIFFSGIGGSGVSALAGFSAAKGHIVAGSDRLFDRNPEHLLIRQLRARNITLVPQDGKGIDRSFDLAVFSTAVEHTNPDYRQAENLGVPLQTRPQYLEHIVSQYRTTAIAGTSGKSTTAGLLSYLMHRLEMKPNFIGGGRVKQFSSPGNPGNYFFGESDVLVMEACESDGTIINYTPHCSIILNLDLDHHEISKTAAMFRQLAVNTSEFVVSGADDINLSTAKITGDISFSVDRPSDYQARHILYKRFRTLFTVKGQNFELPLPGRHNLYNALACIAFLSETGVPADHLADILAEFKGIERRFDVHLDNGAYLVIDDYAHNPHKIGALMKTVQAVSNSVCYIFQPHGYGPTRLMKQGYIETFSRNLRTSDELILLPIYYAGGTVSEDISSGSLAERIAAYGRSVRVAEDRSMVIDLLGRWETYVVLGARDNSLSEFAAEIAARLK